MSAAYLAIDWGSTHRRSWAVTSDGRVIDHSRDACGIKALKPGEYPGSVADLRRQFGELPVLAAGMVGSANGWAEAPYVAAPAGLDALAARLLTLDGDVRIVPGLRTADTDPPDVMRGEEVPLLGAVVAGLIPPEAQVLKPGTHSKFAVLADGRITRFRTAMTGEVFALLKEHSLLAAMLQAEIADGPAFREGVREGRDRDLLSALFGVLSLIHI